MGEEKTTQAAFLFHSRRMAQECSRPIVFQPRMGEEGAHREGARSVKRGGLSARTLPTVKN